VIRYRKDIVMPDNAEMQLSDFETWSPGLTPVTEQQKHDVVWLDSPAGLAWANDQKPKRKPMPRGDEHKVVAKHINRFMRGMSEDKLSRMAEGKYDHTLWQMPYYHTAYMTDLNAYWHWYQNIRPGFHSGSLSQMLEAPDVYKMCQAIARERKAVRLQAMRNK
jgi:hypothetical protein